MSGVEDLRKKFSSFCSTANVFRVLGWFSNKNAKWTSTLPRQHFTAQCTVLYTGPCISRPPVQPLKCGLNLKVVLKWGGGYLFWKYKESFGAYWSKIEGSHKNGGVLKGLWPPPLPPSATPHENSLLYTTWHSAIHSIQIYQNKKDRWDSRKPRRQQSRTEHPD